jgi:hypothetical protein
VLLRIISQVVENKAADRKSSSSFQQLPFRIPLSATRVCSKTLSEGERYKMRLIDNLRNAEKLGLANVRRQMDRAKDEWSDVERRIRQRMRVYPQKLRNRIKGAPEPGVEPEKANTTLAAAASQGSKPIISINGQDVPETELERKVS